MTPPALAPRARAARRCCAPSRFVAGCNVRGESAARRAAPHRCAVRPTRSERGAYLARAGNCPGCHTAPGGAAFAGGRGIETPVRHRLRAQHHARRRAPASARWSPAQFWRALHHGRSRDGRLLYPGLPVPELHARDAARTRTRSTPTCAALPPVQPAPTAPHDAALSRTTPRPRWPCGARCSSARARSRPSRSRPAEWNRGAYLVQGLGHCAACHSARNVLGAHAA